MTVTLKGAIRARPLKQVNPSRIGLATSPNVTSLHHHSLPRSRRCRGAQNTAARATYTQSPRPRATCSCYGAHWMPFAPAVTATLALFGSIAAQEPYP